MYMYICICIYIYMCMYICIYIYTLCKAEQPLQGMELQENETQKD